MADFDFQKMHVTIEASRAIVATSKEIVAESKERIKQSKRLIYRRARSNGYHKD